MTPEQLARLEDYLWPNGASRDIWMIVDGARDPRIFGLLLECFYSQHTCLFRGPLAPELEVVAPYLVQLEFEEPKTRRFLRLAWGNCWGILFRSGVSRETLRRHLRTFLLVRTESGERLMFRYYDPRVMRVYLPTCTAGELALVFGPIDRFWMEGERGMVEFELSHAKLVANLPMRDNFHLDGRPWRFATKDDP